MINETVYRELNRMFENSALFKLYRFLKTSSAQSTVIYEPPTNPNTFRFSLDKLHSGDHPEFSLHGSNLRRELRRCGLQVNFDPEGQHVISHPTLNLSSSILQQMAVWYDSKYNEFTSSSSIVTLLFGLLVLEPDPKVVHWSENGQAMEIVNLVEIKKKWGHNGVKNANQWGFYKNMCSESYMTLSHPYLHQNGSKAAWMLVYLKKNEKYTKYYHIGKKHFRHQIMNQRINISTLPFPALQIQQEAPDHPNKLEEKVDHNLLSLHPIKIVNEEVNSLKCFIQKLLAKHPDLSDDLLFTLSLSSQILLWDKKKGSHRSFRNLDNKLI